MAEDGLSTTGCDARISTTGSAGAVGGGVAAAAGDLVPAFDLGGMTVVVWVAYSTTCLRYSTLCSHNSAARMPARGVMVPIFNKARRAPS